MRQTDGLTLALLDDDELVDLMEAERAASGHTLDDLTRQRLWQRLDKALPAAAPRAAPAPAPAQVERAGARLVAVWSGPLVMAAMLVLALGSFLLKAPPRELGGQRAKDGGSGGDLSVPVRLSAYAMQPGGALMPFAPGEAPADATLVFKALTASSAVVALVMQAGEAPPVVRFIGSATRPGVWELLEQGGRTYGYRLDGQDRRPLRFCALAGATEADLTELLSHVGELVPRLDGGSCVVVEGP